MQSLLGLELIESNNFPLTSAWCERRPMMGGQLRVWGMLTVFGNVKSFWEVISSLNEFENSLWKMKELAPGKVTSKTGLSGSDEKISSEPVDLSQRD